MHIYKSLLLIIFIVLSCSQAKVVSKVYQRKLLGKDFEKYKEISNRIIFKGFDDKNFKIVLEDIIQIKTDNLRFKEGKSKEKTFWSYFLNNAKEIHFSKYNCTPYQVACAFSNQKGILYLNSRYFYQVKNERVTTLLHEVTHHYLSSYTHEECVGKITKVLYSCDTQVFSPYGIEKIYRKKRKSKYHRATVINN